MRKKFSKKCKKSFSKKGFTLIETLLTILVFGILMVMITGIFSSFLQSTFAAKKAQRGLENAQYTLNLMAKVIRTSNVSTLSATAPNLDFALADNKTLKLFDNSQSVCVAYRYDEANHKIQMAKFPSTNENISGCNFAGVAFTEDLTGNDITSMKVSGTTSKTDEYGHITVSLEVSEESVQPYSIPIQMTVSLRNKEEGAVFSCQNPVANSSPCNGTGVALANNSTNYDVVGVCSNPQQAGKCETKCNINFIMSGNSCVPVSYNCTNLQANANPCLGTGTNLAGNTPYNLVASCSGSQIGKCESTCKATFTLVGGQCQDQSSPTKPSGLIATATGQTTVSLSWSASSDNVGVTGYTIYRNGVQVATTASTNYNDSGLSAGITYTYTVDAFDASSNHSALSAAVNVTTQSSSNGVCGNAHRSFAPLGTLGSTSSNLCSAGTVNSFMDDYDPANSGTFFYYYWKCVGSNSTAACYAPQSQPCMTESAPAFNGVCSTGAGASLPNGCGYEHVYNTGGTSHTEVYTCNNGVWSGGLEDGGPGSGKSDTWSDYCGGFSNKFISC